MAINKISGNILADNLVRGSNLAIQSNLVYFDVTNNRVGVGTSVPADTLSVIGVANASNVRITSATANGIFYADTNKFDVIDVRGSYTMQDWHHISQTLSIALSTSFKFKVRDLIQSHE